MSWSGLSLKNIFVLATGIIIGRIAIDKIVKYGASNNSQSNYNYNAKDSNNSKIKSNLDNNFTSSGIQNNSKSSIYDNISKGLSDIGKKI